jgi:lipid II isoglutaminyl synthase (glutamine-hydrolysing)
LLPLKSKFKGDTELFDDSTVGHVNIPIKGDFNTKNINAVLTSVAILGIKRETALGFLRSFNPAYGRGEVVTYKAKTVQVFLAKNPVSFNNNLSLLSANEIAADTILFVLNDDPRDGRDVSWIYDIDTVFLQKAVTGKILYVSGTRAYDMVIRLSYANLHIEPEHVVCDLKSTLENIGRNSAVHSVVALPNYSAMLSLRKILVGRHIL